jgi:WhiB family redox-sensing transcriptional regulator
MNESTLAWLMMPDSPDSPMTVGELLGRPPWHAKALCRGVGTREFIDAPTDTAKSLCRLCPVREDCLDYALMDPSLVGIWAGTDETERRHLRRRAVA